MPKLFIIVLFVSLLGFTTMTFAQSDKSDLSENSSKKSENQQENKSQNQKNETEDELEDEIEKVNKASKKEGSPSATCAPEGVWKNHGDYVSCVAKLKEGGQTVSEAAKSDIGKKNATSSASPSASGSAEPSPTSEPSPTASASGSLTESVQQEIATIFLTISSLLQRLQELLPF